MFPWKDYKEARKPLNKITQNIHLDLSDNYTLKFFPSIFLALKKKNNKFKNEIINILYYLALGKLSTPILLQAIDEI